MFCRYCGKEIPDNATFCPNCGKAQPADNGPSVRSDTGTVSSSVWNEEETVIMKARLHWVTLMPYLPLALLALVILINLNLPVLGLIAVVALMADPVVKYATTTLSFTNRRLIGRQGLLRTQSLDSPLNKINNVDVRSDLAGKLLGYGKLEIYTSSGCYTYAHIQEPEDFMNALMQQIDRFEDDQIKKQAMEMAAAMNASGNIYERRN